MSCRPPGYRSLCRSAVKQGLAAGKPPKTKKPPLGLRQRRLHALLPAGMSHRGWFKPYAPTVKGWPVIRSQPPAFPEWQASHSRESKPAPLAAGLGAWGHLQRLLLALVRVCVLAARRIDADEMDRLRREAKEAELAQAYGT
jgi:hypothetical protein